MLNLITSLVAFHHIKPNAVPTNSTIFIISNPWTCKGKNNFQHANASKAPIKSTIFIALKPSLRFSLPFNTSSPAQCLHISPSSLFFRPPCREICPNLWPFFRILFVNSKPWLRSHTATSKIQELKQRAVPRKLTLRSPHQAFPLSQHLKPTVQPRNSTIFLLFDSPLGYTSRGA